MAVPSTTDPPRTAPLSAARAASQRDDAALEEIRQLFARYRRLAHHGVVREPDERSSRRFRAADQSPGRPGR
jgi:hypothetical protein